jgi:hypothetical protein
MRMARTDSESTLGRGQLPNRPSEGVAGKHFGSLLLCPFGPVRVAVAAIPFTGKPPDLFDRPHVSFDLAAFGADAVLPATSTTPSEHHAQLAHHSRLPARTRKPVGAVEKGWATQISSEPGWRTTP